MWYRNNLRKIAFFFVLTLLFAVFLTSSFALTAAERTFLNNLAGDTFAYISSDWATDNHLPWSWRSERDPSGSYANVTEIGLYMLSYIGAYEMKQPWSPTRREVKTELRAVLSQLRTWQTDTVPVDCGGTPRQNAYQNKVFYQWYWVTAVPPHVGCNTEPESYDIVVPSIDNAFLAASLITIREWAEVQGIKAVRRDANRILSAMDFRLWYDPALRLFWLGTFDTPQGDIHGDLYSNENRIINFIARALGQLSKKKYKRSLDALIAEPRTYDNGTPGDTSDDITVKKVNYDGGLFTYLLPSLFINEGKTPYYKKTIKPAIEAQIAYASDKGYEAWGLSDCFDSDPLTPTPNATLSSIYLKNQGARPSSIIDTIEEHPGLVAPYASGMVLNTKLVSTAIANLQTLKAIPHVYPVIDDGTNTPFYYGFRDCVDVLPGSDRYHQVSARYSALAQEFIFLSIAQRQTNFIHKYFYRDAGVVRADREMFGLDIPPTIAPPTPIETPELLPLRDLD